MAGEASEPTLYTKEAAQRLFAVEFHNETWSLLDKTGRSPADDERMVYCAYASARHWLDAGIGVNHQRGEWLIARVYCVLNNTAMALLHAQRCLELSELYSDQLDDFDLPFAYEAMARALALNGAESEAKAYYRQAEEAGAAIVEEDDRELFMAELTGGDWHGLA